METKAEYETGETTIFRRPKNRENLFVQIDKSVFENPDLSWQAKGLLGYILSKPNDWEVRPGDLIHNGTVGRDGIRTILNELVTARYLKRERKNLKSGRFAWEYEVHETPYSPEPSMVEPEMVTPSPVEPPLTKTERKQKGEDTNTSTYQQQNELLADAPPSVPPISGPDPERGYDPKAEYDLVRQAEEDMIAELRASLRPDAAEADAAAWMGYPTTPGFIGGPGIVPAETHAAIAKALEGRDRKVTYIPDDDEIAAAKEMETILRKEVVERLKAGLREGAAEEAARHVKPETCDLDQLRGYGFVDPLGQHLTTDVPPGTDNEEDIPEPAPGILEVQISDEAFACPNCEADVRLSAIDKRSSACPNCGTHLRVIWENDQGDLKTVREPRKGAMGASYTLEIDGQTYTCQSKREQIQAKSLIRTEPTLFRKRLVWFEENAGYRKKFKREEVIGKTTRAVQNDINKRIPAQGDLEEDEHHALRF